MFPNLSSCKNAVISADALLFLISTAKGTSDGLDQTPLLATIAKGQWGPIHPKNQLSLPSNVVGHNNL
jgi:hypothetical protein